MKERLQLLLQNNNISASKLAEILEVQPSGISHILSGRNNPSMEFIVKCLNAFPDVNPEWFIMGSGPMYKSALVTPTEQLPQDSDHKNTHKHVNNDVKSDTKHTTRNDDNFTSFNTLFDLPQSTDYNQEQHKIIPSSSSSKPAKKQPAPIIPGLDGGQQHSGERAAVGSPKKITKVMIFYSDRTVESFDYSE